jgi:hypothetical protein
LLAALWTCLAPAALHAAGDEAAARVLFIEARKLVAAGDYPAACAKFEDSYRLDPGIGTNFNLADCYEHLGRVASAWARFLDVAASTKVAGQPERERVARTRAALLEPKLARLTLEIVATAPDLAIVRDGVPVTAASWHVAVPVDPGTHTIEASAARRLTWKTTIEVPNGPGVVSVVVPELEQAPAQPITAPSLAASVPIRASATVPDLSAAPAIATQPRPPGRWPKAPLAVGSIGVVALAAGAVFGVKFEVENSEAKSICPTSINCKTDEVTRHTALTNSAHTDRAYEIVGLAGGGAALLTAGYLWWREGRRDRSGSLPRASISALPSGQLGLALGGRF